MKNSRNPLRINIGFLLNQPSGTYREFQLDIPAFDLSQEDETHNVRGNLRISRTSEGMLAQADIHAQLPADCARCLMEYDQTLHTTFTELFTFPDQQFYEVPDDESAELTIHADGHIDLAPLLREYLLLEIPINPTCRADCKGLCSTCGANLNQKNCEHDVSTAALFPMQPGS